MLFSVFFRHIVGVLALFVSMAVFADDYSDGMRAYMARDYAQAQMHWLKAAERKDPKSMFNLGLLHEQRLIRGANPRKAENWYRLAGQNGYPAADYHLARLLAASAGAGDQVTQLIKRSASNGYSPARRELGQSALRVEPVRQKTPGRVTASAAADRVLDQNWINAQSASSWTIQLLAFEDMVKVNAFINAHALHDHAAYFAERDQNGTLYKLIYGAYESKDKANNARQSLPQSLKQYGPWLRTLGSVQNVIAGN